MRNHRALLAAPIVLAALAALAVSGCGGSDQPAASTSSTTSTPSATTPAHDLRINSELEKYVTEDWTTMLTDPAGANYAAGVKVVKVHCTPDTGTSVSNCVIDLSNGQSKRFGYIVAADGSLAERTEPKG